MCSGKLSGCQKYVWVYHIPIPGNGKMEVGRLVGLCCGSTAHRADDLPGGNRVPRMHGNFSL